MKKVEKLPAMAVMTDIAKNSRSTTIGQGEAMISRARSRRWRSPQGEQAAEYC
jgi:hypothetical protein